ncbi:Hint domain-containing protein [Dinoroseobacter sp. S375]|uniref:Hint domain-containing protein n=1 Tax=Dinoroseobacter sp. S375 TaxID=3415136 RepID=UPI003C7A9AE4
MPDRDLIAIDNEALLIASGSPSGTPGNPIINNSDTPNGTVFEYVGGFTPVTVVIDDRPGRGSNPNILEDDLPNRHRVVDGGGLVDNGTRVESESRIDLRALNDQGQPTGPLISVYVFSKDGQTSDIWGMGLTQPLIPGKSYVKISGSNNGDIRYDQFVPCFTAGTLLRTPDGPRAIETLRKGDRIWTEAEPEAVIRWVGARRVDGTGALAPIRFAPGALGNSRTLSVSPAHRMLMRTWQAELLFGLPEVLVAAKHLTALPGVTRAPQASVTYCHLLVDGHAIVEAEGCLSESLYPGEVAQDGLDWMAQLELRQIFPELFAQGPGTTAAPCLRAHEAAALLGAG